MPKYLYIIETIGYYPKAIKIGIATNPYNRLDNLQGACPIELRLVASYACDEKLAIRLERGFHHMLAKYHIHGEWFRLTAAKALRIIAKNELPNYTNTLRASEPLVSMPKPETQKEWRKRDAEKRQKILNASKRLGGKHVSWLDRYLFDRSLPN